MKTKLVPVTPGELLWEEFLDPMGISRYRLSKEIGVPAYDTEVARELLAEELEKITRWPSAATL